MMTFLYHFTASIIIIDYIIMILINLIVIQISSFLSFAAAFNMSDLDSDIEEIQEIRGSSVARTSSQTSLRGFLSISANSQVSLTSKLV